MFGVICNKPSLYALFVNIHYIHRDEGSIDVTQHICLCVPSCLLGFLLYAHIIIFIDTTIIHGEYPSV